MPLFIYDIISVFVQNFYSIYKFLVGDLHKHCLYGLLSIDVDCFHLPTRILLTNLRLVEWCLESVTELELNCAYCVLIFEILIVDLLKLCSSLIVLCQACLIPLVDGTSKFNLAQTYERFLFFLFRWDYYLRCSRIILRDVGILKLSHWTI